MDSIIFIVAAVYVCILIVLGGYCSCRRFREMTGNSFSERKGADLFVLRNYFDAGLVPKMPRIALVECLTVLGLFLSLTAAPDGEIFTAGAAVCLGAGSVSGNCLFVSQNCDFFVAVSGRHMFRSVSDGYSRRSFNRPAANETLEIDVGIKKSPLLGEGFNLGSFAVLAEAVADKAAQRNLRTGAVMADDLGRADAADHGATHVAGTDETNDFVKHIKNHLSMYCMLIPEQPAKDSRLSFYKIW